MSNLVARVREYALGRGVELLVVEGPDIERYATARAGPRTLLIVDSGTAAGPHFGEVVYQACERICAAQRVAINVHHPTPRLLVP